MRASNKNQKVGLSGSTEPRPGRAVNGEGEKAQPAKREASANVNRAARPGGLKIGFDLRPIGFVFNF